MRQLPYYLIRRLQVVVLLLCGRKRAALARLDVMGVLAPASCYVMASRAHILAELDDTPGAIKALVDMTRMFPDQSEAWFNLGYLLSGVGRLEEAESAFRSSLAVAPLLDRAWYGLALVLIRQRRLDEAVGALEQNTELQPMSPFGWYQLARVHVDRQRPDMAVKIIHHLKGFEPKVAAQLERETGLRVTSVA